MQSMMYYSMKANKKAQFFPYHDENPRHSFPLVTVSLIAANLVVFFIVFSNLEIWVQQLGFKPATPTLLTILTSMFMHGGIAHILGNMWFLWLFGDNVEDKLGKIWFIIFYLLGGLAATLLHYLTNINSAIPAVGASGAISAVLGAYVVLFPHVRVHVMSRFGANQVSALFMIGFWFVLQFIMGSLSLLQPEGGGIAFWAHIGGFVFGAGAMWVLIKVGIVRR